MLSDEPIGVKPHHDYRLGYGRHKDLMLSEVPADYLLWMLGCKDTKPRLKKIISEFLGVDQPEGDADPDPVSAAVILPGITFRWHQVMTAEYAGDAPALMVVERGALELKNLTSQYTRRPWLEEAIPIPCKHCGAEELLVLRWQHFGNGSRHIRGEYRKCGKFLQFVQQTAAAIAEADRVEEDKK